MIPRPLVFRIPKHGSTRAEYEDAVAWSTRRRRFAVADGASASAFARAWAELLARAYTRGALRADHLIQDLAPIQNVWSHDVEQRDLPWYAQEQVRRGAFAALVGLTLEIDHSWHAMAVGDSCMFHLRAHELLSAFPLTNAEEFGNRPVLIGSRAAANAQVEVITAHGQWQPGDNFMLMSDAIAAAYLKQRCLELQAFRNWVHQMRAQQLMRNDDVSLLHLALPAHAAA